MPGDIDGFSCSAELIVQSRSPLDPKNEISPAELAKAIEEQLRRVRIRIPGSTEAHRIAEVHVYRVAPTLTAIRAAMGAPTPWTKKGKSARGR